MLKITATAAYHFLSIQTIDILIYIYLYIPFRFSVESCTQLTIHASLNLVKILLLIP